MTAFSNRGFRWWIVVFLTVAWAQLCLAESADNNSPRWLKGNLHTHSLWSDGDDYPEMIVDWYKQHHYDFLALSDHNTLLVGQKWTDPATNKGGPEALKKYVERFGTNWVEQGDA